MVLQNQARSPRQMRLPAARALRSRRSTLHSRLEFDDHDVVARANNNNNGDDDDNNNNNNNNGKNDTTTSSSSTTSAAAKTTSTSAAATTSSSSSSTSAATTTSSSSTSAAATTTTSSSSSTTSAAASTSTSAAATSASGSVSIETIVNTATVQVAETTTSGGKTITTEVNSVNIVTGFITHTLAAGATTTAATSSAASTNAVSTNAASTNAAATSASGILIGSSSIAGTSTSAAADTTASATSSADLGTTSSSSGLSSGAMAGIIVGAIFAAIVIGIFIFRKTLVRRRKNRLSTWTKTGMLTTSGPEADMVEKNISSGPSVTPYTFTAPPASMGNSAANMSPNSTMRSIKPNVGRYNSVTRDEAASAPYGAPRSLAPKPPQPSYNNPGMNYPAAAPTPPFARANFGLGPRPGSPGSIMSYGTTNTQTTATANSAGHRAGASAGGGYTMALVRVTYIPTMPDELSITPGETLRIASAFDDGWALCVNARGEQGMVPLECLEGGQGQFLGYKDGNAPAQVQRRDSKRASSLAGAGRSLTSQGR